MNINELLSDELSIKVSQVETVRNLLDEGNTIPFIARYRKEVTGGLDDEVLRKFDDRLKYLLSLQERMDTVIKSIAEQEKLTPELEKQVLNCKTLSELEDVYRPYKPKKKTRAIIAKEQGLEPLANFLLEQIASKDLMAYAATFINEEKKVNSAKDAIQGAEDIICEMIGDNAEYRTWIKKIDEKKAIITSKEIAHQERGVYDMYTDFNELVNHVAPHRVLALNRGENEKFLKVKINQPDEEIINYLKLRIIKVNSPFEKELTDAINDAYTRLIAPSIENEIRSNLTENAEEKSMVVFKETLHQLLLSAPMKNKIVLGFDPGYAHGCKLAVVDITGKVLDTNVIYPTEPRKQIEASKAIVLKLISKYHINMVALGNGTASRESEAFLKNIIKELPSKVDVVIVSEAGASVYSATELAKKEFPDYDTNLRSAVSIARRLQDPLAELVKIPPESIGVGQYQHDMNQKRLNKVLSGVVESCVNSVGVDLNSASPSLLEYVSGISSTIAKNIVTYREENGVFTNREQLKKVSKLGPKAFEQCAGFLRLVGDNPLDNTSVHPESYEITLKLLSLLHLTLKDLNSPVALSALNSIDNIATLAKQLGVGEPTLNDIIEELKKPGRDIREESGEEILRSDITDIKDIQVGMILKGTVRNISDYGCFVDIGVHEDGLVHISELANKFVKHPLDVVHINQIVTVKVINVDLQKKRIGLSIKQAS